ncbi:Na+/H+ antiporter NhaA type [hydrothermal vent metagenome]|uniref:Na+/H+ antiporter NhaA type n=1 Tax=hydrothermal vent metagenome TaxID=652676 RepID=A0A3B1DLF2_9ZZZZ
MKKVTEPRSAFQEFFESESSSGILLILVTILALIVANSPLNELYSTILHAKFSVGFPGAMVDMSVHHWINDGLMAIFFLVIGLEIKRELVSGELSNVRSAVLPIVAALGGAIIPAGIFLIFNSGNEFRTGWGITMATDIAFAVGILTILGSRIPLWAKVFLSALAVVDDLIAVLVIAVFYTADINITALLFAGLSLIGLGILNWRNVSSLAPYLFLGLILWFAVLTSGVHATIAGVLLGFMIPISRKEKDETLAEKAVEGVTLFKRSFDESTDKKKKEIKSEALNFLEDIIVKAESPLHRLEHKLHGFSSFIIVPVFAFANAGVVISSDVLSEAFSSPLTYGIITGLFIGKQIGVFGATWLLAKFGLTNLEQNRETWLIVYGISLLAGIGFTMSLFVSGLAYTDADVIEQSKIGILTASLLAGLLGFFVLKTFTKPSES